MWRDIMSPKARLTFSVLIILILAPLYFLHRAFDGTSLAVETGGQLGSIYIRLIIFMVVAIVIAQIVRAILARFFPVIGMPGDEPDEIEEDERDQHIEARGDRIGYYVLSFGLILMLVQFCLSDIYPGGEWWNVATLDRPIEWAVGVTIFMLISEIAKWASMAIQYRF